MTPMGGERDVGRRLAGARLQRGLSQGTVARLARVAPSYLSRIETGKVHPTVRTLSRIASALRVPMGTLLADVANHGLDGPLPCPVTARGACLLDLVRADGAGNAEKEAYSPRQLQLLQRFAAWLQRVGPDRLRAMEVLLEELLGSAEPDRSPALLGRPVLAMTPQRRHA